AVLNYERIGDTNDPPTGSWCRAADHKIRPHRDNLIRRDANLIELGAWPAIFEFDIAAQFPAELGQAGLKGSGLRLSAKLPPQQSAHQNCDAPFLFARLRVCRERPCGR